MLTSVVDHLRKQKNKDMDLITSSAGKREYKDRLSNKKSKSCCDYDRFVHSFYCDTTTSFQFANGMEDGQSPNQFAESHNAAVNGATITVAKLIKRKTWHMTKNQKITKISGWLSSAAAKVNTIALAKWVPDESSASAVTPSAIHEWTVTTSSADLDVVERINETVIDTEDVNEGDMLFFMIKCDGTTGNTFAHLVVEFSDR